MPTKIDLTEEQVAGMKVVQLRKALKARGLDDKGLKAVLQTRLREAIAQASSPTKAKDASLNEKSS